MKKTDFKETSRLPRWLQILIGILILPFCLLFIFISIAFIIVSWDTVTSIMDFLGLVLLGSILLLGSIWFTNLTVRYILNKPRTKTLDDQMPPWALYLVAIYFIGMPIISIITGKFFEDLEYYLIELTFFVSAGIYYYHLARQKASKKNKK